MININSEKNDSVVYVCREEDECRFDDSTRTDKIFVVFCQDGNARIIGTEGIFDCDLILDSDLNGHPLVSIEDNAFENLDQLKAITLPDTITYISDNPFVGCYALQSIHVSSGNAEFADIDGVLFTHDHSELRVYPIGKAGDHYDIPAGTREIGAAAFAFADLISVNIPNTVVTLNDGAFNSCVYLERITLPDSVVNIGDCVFSRNLELMEAILPSNLQSMGESVFCTCPNLTSIRFGGKNSNFELKDGVLFTQGLETLIAYPSACNKLTYTVPMKTHIIGSGAFTDTYRLKEVHIPPNVEEIGSDCFISFAWNDLGLNEADPKLIKELYRETTLFVSKGSVADRYAKEEIETRHIRYEKKK